jgi:uncharacterized repeat protein (TIGR03803 family)
MKNKLQHQNWSSRMNAAGASAVLALTTVLVSVILTIPAEAQIFTVMHDFVAADGPNTAQSGLIQGANGYLYGTTYDGGANGEGSVYLMTPAGKVTTVYSFCAPGTGGNCVDAGGPGPLTLGSNGKIYGTTNAGGGESVGVVYEMTPAGSPSVLSNFCAVPPDGDNACGADPAGALVQATNGAFYGVAEYGGILGQGVVFEVPPGGTTETIASFGCITGNCNGSVEVVAGLIQGTDNNLYGTTAEGGTGAFGVGQFGGSIFQMMPNGTLTTIYSFCSLSDCTDGQYPLGALIQGPNGNLYGTTAYGGTGTACSTEPGISGCGTIFEITTTGTLTTLYNFCSQSGCPDGEFPAAGLIMGSDGNFYGTTEKGGTASSARCSDNYCGTIFQITPGGALTTLFSFCTNKTGGLCTTGGGPVAQLMQATNGYFYGTTTQAGSNSNNGTIFRLSMDLVPFVETVPTAGKVGAAVKILGTNLTGATSVTFNGTTATFTVASKSEITTTVPSGATTGKVQVVTSGGTLTSNVNFRMP